MCYIGKKKDYFDHAQSANYERHNSLLLVVSRKFFYHRLFISNYEQSSGSHYLKITVIIKFHIAAVTRESERESGMLSNLQQFGVDLMMLLLLNGLLRRSGHAPRGLTHCLLLTAGLVLVQDVVEMSRHVLIRYHLILKSIPH